MLNSFGTTKKDPSPMNTIPPKMIMSNVMTIFANFQASRSPCFSICSVNTGIKAALRAPSPNKRLKRLGILKATVKASHTRPVPKILAQIISLPSPSMRLKKVQLLMVFTE